MHHSGTRHHLLGRKRTILIKLQQFQSIFSKHICRAVPIVVVTLLKLFANTLSHVTAICTQLTPQKNPVKVFTKFITQHRHVERLARLNTLQADT
jgi:hypothetical protein